MSQTRIGVFRMDKYIADIFLLISDSAFSDDGVIGVILLATGMLYCFLGYRTLKFVIALSGFLLAATAAAVLAAVVVPENHVYFFLAVILGGVCGALALLFLYKAGIFVLGAVGTFLIAQAFLAANSAEWAPWVVVAIGVGGGVLALFLEKFIMTCATAVIGSWLLVGAGAALLTGTHVSAPFERTPGFLVENTLLVVIWAFVSLAGAVVQFTAFRTQRPPVSESSSRH